MHSHAMLLQEIGVNQASRKVCTNSDGDHLLARFQVLRGWYQEALERIMECETVDEKRCLVQELRAITDEAKSVALEYRIVHRKQATNVSA